jgi:hypothetical protein
MSFTQKILKKKNDDDIRTARMLGAIRKNLEVLSGNNVEIENVSKQPRKFITEVPVPSFVLEFRGYSRLRDDIYTVDRWNFSQLEEHLNVELIREIDPTATIVDRTRSNFEWFRGSFVATQSHEAFEKLKAAGKDLIPAYAQHCVNILATKQPITSDFLAGYQSEMGTIERLSQEIDSLESAVKAATNLKQAARFLVLAKAEDSDNKLGISDELMSHIDSWATTADNLSKTRKKIQREMSAAKKRIGAIYPEMTMI